LEPYLPSLSRTFSEISINKWGWMKKRREEIKEGPLKIEFDSV